MRTAVGLELKAVRVIRRGDNQRILVPVHNGHITDWTVSEKNATQESEQNVKESERRIGEKNATQESWLTRCGPSRT